MANIRARGWPAIFVFALCLLCEVSAHADDCRLTRAASLDMMIERGKILIPVSIQGTTKVMAIDTGAPLTTLEPQVVQDLNITTHRIYEGMMYTSTGEQFTQMAVVHGFDIDQLHATELRALVGPSSMFGDSRIAGLLGADFLRHYDIDFDFAAKKLNIFTQDHCPGKVIYWPAPAVAVVPIHVVESGHIIVPVKLDGHEIDSLFDTGARISILAQEAATGTFGLKPGSPEMQVAGEFNVGGSVTVYKHTFKTLELEGITIGNPTVYIWEDLAKYQMGQRPQTGSRLSGADERTGVTDFTLGFSELRNLHVYLAYGEQKLYITASGTVAAQAAPAPTDASQTPDTSAKPK